MEDQIRRDRAGRRQAGGAGRGRMAEILSRADRLAARCGTRQAREMAEALGIIVMPRAFAVQRGAYKVILRSRFIFIKSDLSAEMERMVLLHELGHDTLHRDQAVRSGGFEEFDIFAMMDNRMEYEANLFAAQLALPDDEMLAYIDRGYDAGQIARAAGLDVNLVALKADALICRGHRLRAQEYRSDFLRNDHGPER